MEDDNNNVTLLHRRRKAVKVGKEETLLILRSYLGHPTKWADVLDEIRQNLDSLPQDARHLYENSSARQLRDRVSNKLSSLVRKRPDDIPDLDIRRCSSNQCHGETPSAASSSCGGEEDDAPEQRGHGAVNEERPGPAMDHRGQAANALSSSEGEQDRGREIQAEDNVRQNHHQRRRKRPLADLIRENHTLYNRFIKYKVPKLLRQLGVSSSDESD